MTRMSKQGKRRAVSPRRPTPPAKKTGSKKDNLVKGFKEHKNAASVSEVKNLFIPKIKSV